VLRRLCPDRWPSKEEVALLTDMFDGMAVRRDGDAKGAGNAKLRATLGKRNHKKAGIAGEVGESRGATRKWSNGADLGLSSWGGARSAAPAAYFPAAGY